MQSAALPLVLRCNNANLSLMIGVKNKNINKRIGLPMRLKVQSLEKPALHITKPLYFMQIPTIQRTFGTFTSSNKQADSSACKRAKLLSMLISAKKELRLNNENK